jgi:AAA family ATP:ADP antiporter
MPLRQRLSAITKAEPHELVPLGWAFAYFFCLLCGYYLLRPVRDEMAIQGGVQHLPWMMTGTFLTLLSVTPLFGWLSARLSRYALLITVYAFFILHLVIFYGLMASHTAPEWVARVYFVWLSVFNLFVVSIFWSLMADLFTPEQGVRLFGVIAAGGSAGALAGPVLAGFLPALIGIPPLMLIAGLCLLGCLVCIHHLDRWAAGRTRLVHVLDDAPLGGGIWAGIRLTAASPYLLGICGYLYGLTMTATFLYMEQTRTVAGLLSDPEARTQLFARIDLMVSLLTLGLQLFGTNRLIGRFGLAAGLWALPAISLVGFIGLGSSQALMLLLAFTVARRVGEYAVAKPTREVLFTVVPREEKYKAKNFIDTAVSRGGDASTGWLVSGVKALGASTPVIAWALVPLMLLWGWLGWWLADKEREASSVKGER